MTALGAPIVNDATGMIGRLTGVITRLTDVARAHPRAVADIELGVAGIAGIVALSGSMAIAGAALGPLSSGLRLLFTTLRSAPAATAAANAAAAGASGATTAAGGATAAAGATAASRGASMLSRGLGALSLMWAGYSAIRAGQDAEAQVAKHDPRAARQAQWTYDHTYGLLGADMRHLAPTANVTKPLPDVLPLRGNAGAPKTQPAATRAEEGTPESVATGNGGCVTLVSVYLDSDQIAARIVTRQERQARQEMRSSGTAPDVLQHPQVPGRAIGR
ncbi:hypothetical protein LDL36_14035 [Komagataeibacter sp. FNDCR1]|nr:hypothetical protein [Komagataeibacter sp. FNDCR1]